MGVNLGDLVLKKQIKVKDLTARKLAIDGYNTLYQFLSTIRQPDGSPLTDEAGNVTSHLTGLIYRTSKLLENEVKFAFVFDGVPPEVKRRTLEKRSEVKEKARKNWMKALDEEDFEKAKRAAQATSKLTKSMVEDAKEVLLAMGIPCVQAPEEGEAQAAHMCSKGDVWATASQDYDALLFGSPILIRNLSLSGKKKLPGKNIYVKVSPEQINLEESLKEQKLTREQLIDIGILVGNDYINGVKGVGPKTAIKLIQKGKTVKEIYQMKDQSPEVDVDSVKDIFLNPNVIDNYRLEWKKPDPEKLKKVLVDKHSFSEKRIEKVCDRLLGIEDSKNQSRLNKWFK